MTHTHTHTQSTNQQESPALRTEHGDGGGGLCVSQREGRHLAGVHAHVGEANVGQHDGGVVRRGRAEGQAAGELWWDGDAEEGVVDGHRHGPRGQPALPGALGQAEVGAHLHPALQRHVLTQHRLHLLGDQHLAGPGSHCTAHRKHTELHTGPPAAQHAKHTVLHHGPPAAQHRNHTRVTLWVPCCTARKTHRVTLCCTLSYGLSDPA